MKDYEKEERQIVERLFEAQTPEEAKEITNNLDPWWEEEGWDWKVWEDLLADLIVELGYINHPWQKELICDRYFCKDCPFAEVVSERHVNLTPGNSIGTGVVMTVYRCELDGEENEFWD